MGRYLLRKIFFDDVIRRLDRNFTAAGDTFGALKWGPKEASGRIFQWNRGNLGRRNLSSAKKLVTVFNRHQILNFIKIQEPTFGDEN